MNFLKKYGWGLLAVLITALILFLKEGETLAQLGQVLFGDYHDALKNYYTLLYHVQWDESYFHFSGMNYPYGEHVLFTDNQPVIANTLKFINDNLVSLSNQNLIGIANGLLYLNFLLCAWVTYLCLKKLQLAGFYALLIAVGLTFLTPQTFRLNGHFALSYSAIIPLLIYQALHLVERFSQKRALLVALIIAIVAFIHAYYFAFGLIVFLAFSIAIWANTNYSNPQRVMALALTVILPLMAVEAVMIFSDSVADRPAYPWSPFKGNYRPHGIFFPIGKPLGKWIDQAFGIPNVHWEALTYVGMFAGFFFLISTALAPFFLIFRRFRRHPFFQKSNALNFLIILSGIAFVIPIVYGGASKFQVLYELMGPFRQFRAVTRIYWIFFFSMNFFVFAWLYYKLKNAAPVWRHSIFLLPVLTLLYDSYYHSKGEYNSEHHIAAWMEGSEENDQLRQALQEFDAIVPLPYFHIGSEDFVIQADKAEHYRNSMAISHAAGVPMTAVMMSRTSQSQSIEQLAYRYPTLQEPGFLQYLAGKKVALLRTTDTELSAQEQLLWQERGRTVFEGEGYTLAQWNEHEEKVWERIQKLAERITSGPDSLSVLRKNYEQNKEHAYRGEGALQILEKEPRVVDTLAVELDSLRTIQVGFWVRINQSTKAIERVHFQFLDEYGKIRHEQEQDFRGAIKVLDENWAYVEYPFNPPIRNFRLVITQKRNKLHPTSTYIDDLRIYFSDD